MRRQKGKDGSVGLLFPLTEDPLGCEVMRRGLDYFVDKAPFTTLGQLVAAEKTVKETGKRYFVYYSERLHSECSIFAGYLLENDFIGDVVNIIGTGTSHDKRSHQTGMVFRQEEVRRNPLRYRLTSGGAVSLLLRLGQSESGRLIHR